MRPVGKMLPALRASSCPIRWGRALTLYLTLTLTNTHTLALTPIPTPTLTPFLTLTLTHAIPRTQP